MKKSSFFLGGALLLVSLFTTSCKEVLGSLDNPVGAYVEIDETAVAEILPTQEFTRTATTISPEAIVYTSSNESVATVDALTGKVTALKAGTTTITASVPASKDGLYLAGSKSYTVTVVGKVVDLSKETSHYFAEYGDVLTGALNGDYALVIPDGVKVLLKGMSTNPKYWPGIWCYGDATIIIADGSENTVVSQTSERAGIQIGPKGKKLTIEAEKEGTGKLTAIGRMYAAGIGNGSAEVSGDIEIKGGVIEAIARDRSLSSTWGASAGIGTDDDGGSVGDITISGGTVTALGYDGGAGIGTCWSGPSCGNITITKDVKIVTAVKGTNAYSCIGKSNINSPVGTITIGGKTDVDTTGESYVYEPSK